MYKWIYIKTDIRFKIKLDEENVFSDDDLAEHVASWMKNVLIFVSCKSETYSSTMFEKVNYRTSYRRSIDIL